MRAVFHLVKPDKMADWPIEFLIGIGGTYLLVYMLGLWIRFNLRSCMIKS